MQWLIYFRKQALRYLVINSLFSNVNKSLHIAKMFLFLLFLPFKIVNGLTYVLQEKHFYFIKPLVVGLERTFTRKKHTDFTVDVIQIRGHGWSEYKHWLKNRLQKSHDQMRHFTVNSFLVFTAIRSFVIFDWLCTRDIC